VLNNTTYASMKIHQSYFAALEPLMQEIETGDYLPYLQNRAASRIQYTLRRSDYLIESCFELFVLLVCQI
ncbi:hypothetical protein, partial [Vibrio anguillarum]|uniref:hypothetical protein n=1 Tax=Vibrio anguillarum TaxID=55601 RepID=UPI001BE4CF1C